MTEIAFWIAHILVAVCGLTRYGWRHVFLSLTPRSSFASMSSDPLTGAVRPNRLASTVARLQPLPSGLRTWVVSLLLGRAVPLVGTAGLRFEQITSDRVVVRVANRRKVQNHIGGVHAAGMVLLAETATGFCVGMNVPDDKLPLIMSMKVDFQRRAVGGMTAVASLQPEQIALMRSQDKGEVTVPVVITDESGQQPIQAEMIWAWVPKQRQVSARP